MATSFEQTLIDAFKLAEASRKSAGLVARQIKDHTRTLKNGQTRTGPSSYKITLWLRPYVYADAMVAKSISERPGQSLTKFLTTQLENIIPNIAARPTPRAKKEEQPARGAGISPLRTQRLKKQAKGLAVPMARAARTPAPRRTYVTA